MEAEIQGIIGLIVGYVILFCMVGWLTYSFYIKPEILDKKKHL